MESQYGIKQSTQQQLLVVPHVLCGVPLRHLIYLVLSHYFILVLNKNHRGNQNDPDWGDLTSTNINKHMGPYILDALRIPQSDLFWGCTEMILEAQKWRALNYLAENTAYTQSIHIWLEPRKEGSQDQALARVHEVPWGTQIWWPKNL